MRKRIIAVLVASFLVTGSLPSTLGTSRALALEGDLTVLTNESDTASVGEMLQTAEVEVDDLSSQTALTNSEEENELSFKTEIDLEAYLNSEYVEGEVIVIFKTYLGVEQAQAILEDIEAVDESSITEESMLTDSIAVVAVSDDASVIEAILELSENSAVAFAQPNFIYHLLDDGVSDGDLKPDGASDGDLEPLTTIPNDTSLALQWGLTTARVFDAWTLTQATLANPRVSIAVIDTGALITHEDLAANIYPGSYFDVTGENYTNGDSLGQTHGTHVAGIAAAVANNSTGVAGVSYNAYIVPIKVFYYDPNYRDPVSGLVVGGSVSNTSLAVAAITHLLTIGSNGKTLAQEYNVKVINMSFGGTSNDPALETSVNSATNAGILCVAAAGNSANNTPHYPAAYANCISVTGLKQGIGVLNDVFDSSYSSYGSTVNLSAPGTGIYSTTNYNTASYGSMRGTSMAAPFVSGAAALAFAANPSATPAEVQDALQSTARDLGAPGWDLYYGYGEVDPYSAAWQIAVTGINYTTPQGISIPITCSVKTTLPGLMTWNWSVNSADGTITPSGVFTPNRSGTIRVTATYTNDPALFATVDIEVPAVTITLAPYTSTYTGAEIRPAVTVRNAGTILTENYDFTIRYANNINAGTSATVIVEGTGGGTINWIGSETATFTITPALISAANISVGVIGKVAYTGAALTPSPTVTLNASKQLDVNTDYSLSYSNNINLTNDGAQVTITGKGNFTGTRTVNFSVVGIMITTRAHVQNIGWMTPVANGGVAGTSGQSLRVEALQVDLINNTGYPGGISYSVHVQNIGWQGARSVSSTGLSTALNTGGIAGTSGQSLRLETLRMNLTGALAQYYSVYYRVHVQDVGWMNWAKDGEHAAGSVGLSLRMEAVQIYVALKTEPAPTKTYGGITTAANTPCVIDASAAGTADSVAYNAMVHVQNIGNVYYSNTTGSTILGTSGQSLRLEAMELQLVNQPALGSIVYSTHVQNIGWQASVLDGNLAGTQGKSLRVEAVRISLTGAMAAQCDIYYRTHIQNIGWTGWARNGQSCGSAGYSYRMEAIQIMIVPKDTVAPGFNQSYFYQT